MLLVSAVLVSGWTHSLVLEHFLAPTFGNSGVHLASMRHVLEHQEYPMNDYSYGGGVPNLYVPLYRMGGASLSLLTGLDLDAGARLIVLLIALLLPLGTYALVRTLFQNPWAGLAAAFLVSAPSELLVYTVRPLPQALGHALLPLAWLGLAARKPELALPLAFLTGWVHQEAAVFHAGVAFALGAAGLLAWKVDGRASERKEWLAYARLAFAAWAVTAVAYLGWHHLIVGAPPIWELSQFKYHEGGPLGYDTLWSKSGNTLSALALVGLGVALARLYRRPAPRAGVGLALSVMLLAVGLFTVKNDVVGIRVFMDRFLVYLQQAAVPLAGLGLAWLGERASKL
jgi:nitrate reductase NapE component